MPLKSDWSDSEEEEKDTKEQNNIEEEVEDWDSDLQKTEQELKNNITKTSKLALNTLPCQTQKHLPHRPLL